MSDFRGKLVILDFFGTSCVPCVKALPKMDSLQTKFKNDLQVILVTYESKDVVNEFLDRLKRREDINLIFSTGDTGLSNLFKHSSIPFYVIVGKDGLIKGMPPHEEVNEKNIASLINGIKLNLPAANYEERHVAVAHRAILIDSKSNDDGLVIYHSILTRYLPMLPSGYLNHEYKDTTISARITVMNCNIGTLYQVAYGHFNGDREASFVSWNRVIIETGDSVKLKWNDKEYLTWRLANAFCYDLILPNSFKGDAHDVMKEDLKRLYNYDVKMEKRKTKCLVLRRTCGGDDLVSLGGKEEMNMNAYFIKMQNASWKDMLYWLENKFLQELPLIDETGYDRINLDVNADLTDSKALAKALKPIGIELAEEEREVDMLVIKDKM